MERREVMVTKTTRRGMAVTLSCCLLALLSASPCWAVKVEDTCEIKGDQVVDKATGISFDTKTSFPFDASTRYGLLGAGPRRKNLYVAQVNVYSVGLYVSESAFPSQFKKFKGKDANTLAQDASYYDTLLSGGVTNKALHLKFARSVAAVKVVEALTSIQGVPEDVMAKFSSSLLQAIGTQIGKGETLTLGWVSKGGDKLAVEVRGKAVVTLPSKELVHGIYKLFLGTEPISVEAKASFAARAPALLG